MIKKTWLVLIAIIVVVILALYVLPEMGVLGNVDVTISTTPGFCDVIITHAYTQERVTANTGSIGRTTVGLDGGLYTIEILKAGFQPISQPLSVDLSPPFKFVSYTLEPIQSGQSLYSLRVVTTPSRCTVELVGHGTKSSGDSGCTWSSLVSGAYTLIVSRTSYQTATQSFSLDSDTYKSITLTYIGSGGGGGGTPDNDPPSITSIAGLETFLVKTTSTYVVNAHDPQGDPMQYYFDWGDGTTDGWTSTNTKDHIWNKYGDYIITVKVKDSYNSERSKTKSVTVDGISLPAPSIQITDGIKKGEAVTAVVTVDTLVESSLFTIEAYVKDATGSSVINEWTDFAKTFENDVYTANVVFTCYVNGRTTIGARAKSRDSDVYINSNSMETTTMCSADGTGTGLDKYNILFKIRDTEGTPVYGATVTFNGIEYLTDEKGETSFESPEGSYEFIVEKSGYKSLTNTIDLNSDATINVELALSGSDDSSRSGDDSILPDISEIELGFTTIILSIIIIAVGFIVSLVFLPTLPVKIIGVILTIVIVFFLILFGVI